jgi:hypothetical protein
LLREVHRGSERISLGRLAFDFLSLLIEHRVLSNADASARLWPGDDNTDQKLKDLFRRLYTALGDVDRENPQYFRREAGYIRLIESALESRQTPSATAQSKVLYVKLIHMRRKGHDTPAYVAQSTHGKRGFDVYDEALYYSLHMFEEQQPFWEWNIVSTGESPVTHITHPWQDKPDYFDPQLAMIPSPHITPRCSESSATYLTVTTMYNGLQPGHEEVYAKVEVDASYVRLIVDFASLPDPKPTFARRPTGVLASFHPPTETAVEVQESYPFIFTARSRDLKKGQILKIRWTLAAPRSRQSSSGKRRRV